MDLSFLLKSQSNGQYGIDSISKLVTAANRFYDLIAAVYLDDKKINREDLTDLVTLGPATVNAVIEAANGASMLDEEITDLSEAEKNQVVILAGSRIKQPGYIKILKGLLDVTDGVSELTNPGNPTE